MPTINVHHKGFDIVGECIDSGKHPLAIVRQITKWNPETFQWYAAGYDVVDFGNENRIGDRLSEYRKTTPNAIYEVAHTQFYKKRK